MLKLNVSMLQFLILFVSISFGMNWIPVEGIKSFPKWLRSGAKLTTHRATSDDVSINVQTPRRFINTTQKLTSEQYVELNHYLIVNDGDVYLTVKNVMHEESWETGHIILDATLITELLKEYKPSKTASNPEELYPTYAKSVKNVTPDNDNKENVNPDNKGNDVEKVKYLDKHGGVLVGIRSKSNRSILQKIGSHALHQSWFVVNDTLYTTLCMIIILGAFYPFLSAAAVRIHYDINQKYWSDHAFSRLFLQVCDEDPMRAVNRKAYLGVEDSIRAGKELFHYFTPIIQNLGAVGITVYGGSWAALRRLLLTIPLSGSKVNGVFGQLNLLQDKELLPIELNRRIEDEAYSKVFCKPFEVPEWGNYLEKSFKGVSRRNTEAYRTGFMFVTSMAALFFLQFLAAHPDLWDAIGSITSTIGAYTGFFYEEFLRILWFFFQIALEVAKEKEEDKANHSKRK